MAKVTFEFTDNDADEVDINIVMEPPMEEGDIPTSAQRMAVYISNYITNGIEDE